jgi:hypothetical protein
MGRTRASCLAAGWSGLLVLASCCAGAGAAAMGPKPLRTTELAPRARRLHEEQLPGAAPGAAAPSAIKKCLWSESVGCALNPSYMFTVGAQPDSYERCACARRMV